MGVGSRWGARLSVVVVASAVPVSMTVLTPPLRPVAEAGSAFQAAVPAAVTAPLPGPGVRRVAPRTTIVGSLELVTAAERHRRISVSSAKGSHVWTASSLAEHDLPSAAMRAYKHAARTLAHVEPGCRLPWTLLAGIGRVESDHGRYGGSVLGADGVPRPAIIGIPLNGKGPVAAVHDTDHGRFDGDKVWDRAVGPMQFIPSTWRTAGLDGDGDGLRNPNDIDDAALAAGAYLCHGGRDLSRTTEVRAAVFSYNPSTYYVDLVTAFARGYRTGTFVIPSPPVASGPAVHRHGHAAKTRKAAARARMAAARKAAARKEAAKRAEKRAHRHPVVTSVDAGHGHKVRPKPEPKPAPSSKPSPKPTPSPKPSPKPSPRPSPSPKPTPLTAHGPLTKDADGNWHVQAVTLTADDVAAIEVADYDHDGRTEAITEELDGLADAATVVTLSYTVKPFEVVGFGVG